MSYFDHLFRAKGIRPVLQSEAAECGLASMAMVLAYHGRRIDLRRLRAQFGVSIKGATLKGLMTIADRSGLAPRPLRMEIGHLNNLHLPAILHWDMNHFVVLSAVKRDHLVIFDPARGKTTMAKSDAAKHFTGIALELRPTHAFEKTIEETPARLTDFWTKITGLKRSIIQALIPGSRPINLSVVDENRGLRDQAWLGMRPGGPDERHNVIYWFHIFTPRAWTAVANAALPGLVIGPLFLLPGALPSQKTAHVYADKFIGLDPSAII